MHLEGEKIKSNFNMQFCNLNFYNKYVKLAI